MSQISLFKILGIGSTQSEDIRVFDGLQVRIRRRSYQRNINVRLNPNAEIRITCGMGVKANEIQKFLHELRPWLQKGLSELESRRQEFPPLSFYEGETFPFLGEKYKLSFNNCQSKRLAFELQSQQLVCRWPSAEVPPTDEELSHALKRFYKTKAQIVLKEKVEFFSQQMDLTPKNISFRWQKSRWGSCSSTGMISLNIKLITFPPPVIDYVIVHELAHLKFANHGENFWALVERHCGDYRQHRRWLKKEGYWLAAALPLR